MVSRRRLAVWGGIFMVLVLGVWLVSARLPGLVSNWAFTALERNLAITGRVGAVELNPITLVVRIHDLTLWAVGHERDPFLTAEAVTIDLPWAAVVGSSVIESVEIVAPAVSVRRSPDGGLNLPQSPDDAPAPRTSTPGQPWRFGAIDLQRGTLTAVDEVNGLRVTLDPVRLRLEAEETNGDRIGGDLVFERPTAITWGAGQTAIQPLTVSLAFDGSTLVITDLDAVAPEGRLRLDGDIALGDESATVALSYRVDVDLDELAAWVPSSTWSGGLSVAGRVDGSVASPAGTARLDAARVRWEALEARDVSVQVELAGRQVTVTELAAEIAGGVIGGIGAATLLDDPAGDQTNLQTSGELNLFWTDLDSAQVVAAAGAPSSGPIAAMPSTLSGTLDGSWASHDPPDWVMTVETQHVAPAGVPTAVGGRWRADIDSGVWRVGVDELTSSSASASGELTGSMPGSWSLADLRSVALQGSLAVDVSDLRRLGADLEIAGVTIGGQSGVSGTAALALDIAGTGGSPEVLGVLRATGRVFGDDPLALDTSVSINADQWRIEPFDLQLAGGQFTGAVNVDPETREVEGALRVGVTDLGTFEAWFPAGWQPQGAVEVDGTFSGQWPASRFDAAIEARDVLVAGQRARVIRGRVGATRDEVVLEGITVAQADTDARLEADGSLDVDGRYTLSVTGRGVQVFPWLDGTEASVPVGATVDLDVRGEGTLDAPQGSGRVVLHNPSFRDYTVERVEHDVVVDDDGWRVRTIVPGLSASADLTLHPGPPWRYELDGALARTDLVRLGALAGWDPASVDGTLGLRLRANGMVADLDGATVDIELQHLDARLLGTPVTLADTAELRYGPEGLSVGDLDLRIGDTRLTATGMLAESVGTGAGLRVAATGDLRDLGALLDNVDALGIDGVPPLSGPFQLEVAATGNLERPSVTASLAVDRGAIAAVGVPPVSELTLRADYGPDGLRLERLQGLIAGATLSADGLIPPAVLAPWLPARLNQPGDPDQRFQPAALTARVDELTPAAIAGLFGTDALDGLTGTLGVAVEVEAGRFDLAALRGTLQLEALDLELAGLPVAQRRPTRLVLEDERLTVERFAWQIGAAGNTVTLGGGIDLAPVPTADLTLTGRADLRALNVFTNAVAVTGDALLIANLGGTLAEPRVDGVVELDNAELRVPEPGLLVSGLSGALVFQGTEMQLVDMAGTANGGPVGLEGTFRFPGLAPEGEVSLTGRAIAMVLPPGVRTEIDTDLLLQVDPEDAVLSGTVSLVRGDYREPINATGGLLALLESRPPPAVVGDEPSWLDGLRLDLRVLTDEDMVVSNNYGVGTIGADARLGGTVARPAVTGRATVGDGGQVFLGGNTFEIESATVDFIDPDGIVPEIDATARTRVGQEEITITFEGTAETLTTTMQTVSGLAESDIVSLLLTGRTLEDVGSAPGIVARDQALGLVSGEVLGVAGRSVGLDTVRLDRGLDVSLVAGETNPGTRVTVGKHLSRQVELVASQSLRGSGLLTWIVNYLPRPNVEVRLVIDDETDRAYEFRHAVSFGGTRATGTRRADARVVPRVAAIEFSGAMELSEPELRGLVRLEEGDEFDFLRWQDSRDRIERTLWDRGYQEARVRMRRTPDEDGATVALGLDIDAGPRCVIEPRGYAVPDSLVAEMEEAWRESVFDTFLVEELEQIARRWLAGEGYPRPTVSVEVSATPGGDEKRIVLDLAPGLRVRGRAIRFTGNSALSAESLGAVLTDDLESDVWAGGTAFVDTVRAAYRAAGWLAVEVSLDTLRVEGDTAVLGVEVSEGPRFEVSDIAVVGAVGWDAEQVLAVAGIDPGVVYSAGLAEVARTGVLVAYRRAGFNAVRVRVEASVAREEGQVSLRILVDEGRRQLLREVEIVGGEGTHAGLIDRALRLTPGAPVDQALWNQARKRLYDTGVFRSVDIAAVPDQPPEAEPVALDEPVTARVTLEPWPLYQLRYGMQVIDERAPAGETPSRGQFGAVADLTRRNLFGRAISLGTAVRYDTIQQAVRGFMSVPSFFGRQVTSNVFVSRLRETLGADRSTISDRHRLTFEQQIRPTEGVTFSYSYNFDRNHTFEEDFDPNDPFAFNVNVDIARLNTSLVFEHRDDLFDATRGWFHASTIEWGVETLGSDLRFLKYVGQHYYFHPLGRGLVLASAARVGLGKGFGQELIPSERFFAGGGNTVRGYSQDSLGPLSFFGDPGGGSASLIFNQELRLPVWSLFRGVGFVDAGNVFSSVRDLSLTALKVAVGLGLRAETPVGLFRLDYGIPLSRREDDPRGRWFASLGQAF